MGQQCHEEQHEIGLVMLSIDIAQITGSQTFQPPNPLSKMTLQWNLPILETTKRKKRFTLQPAQGSFSIFTMVEVTFWRFSLALNWSDLGPLQWLCVALQQELRYLCSQLSIAFNTFFLVSRGGSLSHLQVFFVAVFTGKDHSGGLLSSKWTKAWLPTCK